MNNPANSGFTLLELLISVTIFSFGALSIAAMLLCSMNNNTRANTGTSATAVAQGVLEEVLSLSSTDPIFAASATTVFDLDPADASTNSLVLDGAGTYQADLIVQRNSPVLGLHTITISVQGQERQVALTGFKGAF